MLELDKREHCTFSECCLVEYVTVNKLVLSYNLYTGATTHVIVTWDQQRSPNLTECQRQLKVLSLNLNLSHLSYLSN